MKEKPADAFELPSGNWVRLKSPLEITWGERRKISMRAKRHDDLVAEQEKDPSTVSDDKIAEALFSWIDGVIIAFVREWSYEFDIPDPETSYPLDPLPTIDRDQLDLKCCKELYPQTYLRVTVDDALDPASPTEPSGASESASPEGTEASKATTPKRTRSGASVS